MNKRLKQLDLRNIIINDNFWNDRMRNAVENGIPYMWNALNDNIPNVAPSYCMQNFRIAAGLEQGKHQGCQWQDTDLYKFIEAVGYLLQTKNDPELEKLVDDAVDLIEKAQLKDGYLDTYYSIDNIENRWTNMRENHELYSMGHFIESAVSYYSATGKKKILDVACRLADYLCSIFGNEDGKIKGYCGHEEIELALFKLYNTTKNEAYIQLAKYFIDQRGTKPFYFVEEFQKLTNDDKHDWMYRFGVEPYVYNQSHLPVREQKDAIGHAVRAMYLYAAVADVASETNDDELMQTAETLWNSTTQRQMHITGGIGTQLAGESFTFDYDLPNDTTYNETCASIGLMMFAQRMQQINKDAKYSDVVECALYNGMLSGISLDGTKYFYVNPMEVVPEMLKKREGLSQINYQRQGWFGCACCPPNVLRTLTNLGAYIYSQGDDTAYINLYIGGEAVFNFKGKNIKLEQKTSYPWDEKVEITIKDSAEFDLALRIPYWCKGASITINGENVDLDSISYKGYAVIKRHWENGDKVVLTLPMPIQKVRANPKVRADAGKVAIQRGPIVYCLEQVDNGEMLWNISISNDTQFTAVFDETLLDGVVEIEATAKRTDDSQWNTLYSAMDACSIKPVKAKFVPYYAWSNREPGEMIVWILSD